MDFTDKDIAYLKKKLSAQDLVDIVAIKNKMNERARRTGNNPINESEEISESISSSYVDGFKKFCEEYLDDNERHQIELIFGKLTNDVVNQRFLQPVYSCMTDLIDKIDQEMIDSAN